MQDKLIPYTALVLYIISMFLPGIVYPGLNPKFGLCSSAKEDNMACVKSVDGYSCSRIEPGKPINPEAMSKQDIDIYCGQDWDVPTSEYYYGYLIFAIGWLGFITLNFAWWGNPLFLMTFMYIRKKNFKDALIATVAALIFGLMAFIRKIPSGNFGSGDGTIVYQLGIGYYVWMISIFLLFLYSYKKFKSNN